MKAVPTDEESAAIAAALLRRDAAPDETTERGASRWGETARREGVCATLPYGWNG